MMRALLVVAFLCGVGMASHPVNRSLDTDLDSVLCSSKTHTGKIVDIHESITRGADLLNGIVTASLELCSSGCCKTNGCDMVLYKNHGYSKSGNNCYYVHCGKVENCVLVDHSSFTSVLFHHTQTSANTDHTPKTSPRPTAIPTRTTPVPTATPPFPSTTPPSPITTLPLTSAGTSPDLSSANHTPNSANHTPNSAPTEESKIAEKLSSDGNIGKKKVNTGKQKVIASPDQDKPSRDSDCGHYGCDGSGIVAVVVVAVICFAIVMVVVAILLKKVVGERRQRRFKNVDYLINGMYT